MRERESLRQLKKYPVFRVWRAKAETTRRGSAPWRPRLKKKGTFDQIIDSRTVSFWNALTDARAGGSNQHAAI